MYIIYINSVLSFMARHLHTTFNEHSFSMGAIRKINNNINVLVSAMANRTHVKDLLTRICKSIMSWWNVNGSGGLNIPGNLLQYTFVILKINDHWTDVLEHFYRLTRIVR